MGVARKQPISLWVDVSDIFLFFLLGAGEGDRFLLKSSEGGVSQERGGRGGRVFAGKLGGGGGQIFFSGSKFPPRP